MSKWINSLWLSFFSAVLGEVVFFALIDPKQLYLFGEPVSWSPMVIYSGGFFMFWSLTALTAAVATLMQKPGEEVNREPEIRARQARDKASMESAQV